MSFTNDSIAKVKILPHILTVAYAILLSLLFLIAIIGARYDIPLAHFTRDPAAILHAHPFTGIMSNIGILFWCSTSAICFFASAIHSKKGSAKVATFQLFSGLLTSVLLLDDLFMLHESIFPKYMRITEKPTYLGYLALVTIYLIKFRSVLFQTEYIILFIACSFFALSIICDVVLLEKGMEFLIEDGFKLFGIVTWFIFFTKTCLDQTQQIVDS